MHHQHTGKIQVLHDRFVERLVEPEVWAQLMRVAAAHPLRGPVNCVMIAAQMPQATDVRTRAEWESLGYQVLEGQHGIQIFTSPDDHGTRTGARKPFPPDGTPWPLCPEEEYHSCIEEYDTAMVFDISQTSAANWELNPLPVEFIEDVSVSMLQMDYGVDVDVSSSPTETTALARLQDLARLWLREDGDWGGTEAEAISVAHVVARMAGMSAPGTAPVPTQLPQPVGCNPAIKIAAIRVIRVARELYDQITETCPCCGQLADQCIEI